MSLKKDEMTLKKGQEITFKDWKDMLIDVKTMEWNGKEWVEVKKGKE